jgi:hypothetical protein
VHYALTSNVTEADPVVADLDAFRTKEPTLYFLAIDSTGNHAAGEPKKWTVKLKVRYQVNNHVDYRDVEIAVTPSYKAKIQYSIDGTSPRNGRVYDGPARIPNEQVLLQVYVTAVDAVAEETFTIPARNGPELIINPTKPAKLVREKPRFDTTNAVFELVTRFRERQGIVFHGVKLNVGEGEQAVQVSFNDRAVTPSILESIITALRNGLNEPDALVQLTVRDGASFDSGFDLKTFAELARIDLTRDNVEQ